MLKELINQYYIDNRKDRQQRHFYISDAGKCSRQVFFAFKGIPGKPIDANFLRLFDHGDSIHRMILKSLLNIKDIRIVASEVDIPPQELISGRADAIIEREKQLYVLDVKSINSRAFGYLKEAKEENVLQLQLYLHYLEIQKGILLYVDKDKLRLKEFIIDYNQTTAKMVLKGLVKLREQIDSNVLPSRLSDYPKSWRCRYCKFVEICKKD